MVIQHNILALNTTRQNNLVVKSKQKQMKRLSSGYKINCAADNAAGLSISEKMRKQVRGLTRAVENIEDGVSLCQVADGALTEVQEILQRMNELSIQSANGTNSQSDRSYIQDEVDALTTEIDRIAYATKFNEDIYPLLGKTENVSSGKILSSSISSEDFHWELPSEIKEIAVTIGVAKVAGGIYDPLGTTVNGVQIFGSQTISAIFLYHENLKGKYNIVGNAQQILGSLTGGSHDTYIHTYNHTDHTRGLTLNELNIDNEGRIYYHRWSDNRKEYLIDVYSDVMASGSIHYVESTDGINFILAKKIVDNNNNTNENTNNNNKNDNIKSDVWIQMGAEAKEGMYINLVNATAKGIGLEGISVLTEESSEKAIDTVSAALRKVSKYRSTFGAQQNRLEHGILINENTIENTTAAESRIRDTDMAKEMVKFSIQNILGQIGQSMLAQANQSNQGVLNLLT